VNAALARPFHCLHTRAQQKKADSAAAAE